MLAEALLFQLILPQPDVLGPLDYFKFQGSSSVTDLAVTACSPRQHLFPYPAYLVLDCEFTRPYLFCYSTNFSNYKYLCPL